MADAAAAAGDLQSAKLLAPFMNQAYGMPAEREATEVPANAVGFLITIPRLVSLAADASTECQGATFNLNPGIDAQWTTVG